MIFITGPNPNGIGEEPVLSLGSVSPKRIILTGRGEAKIKPVMEQIKEMNSKADVKIIPLDLSDNASVQGTAKKINLTIDHLDILVNNAGLMAIKDYAKLADGFEMQCVSNPFGHFLLAILPMSNIITAKSDHKCVEQGHELAEGNFDNLKF